VEVRPRVANLVAEDERLVWLLLAFGVDAEPLQDSAQALGRDRHQPRPLLFVVSPRKTISPRAMSTPANRSASISPRRIPGSSAVMIIERRCGGAAASNRSSSSAESRRRRWLSSRSFLISVSVPRLNGVLSQVLAPDRPVQHVPEQLDRAVDRGRREATFLSVPADYARFAEVSDEVLDVGCLDICERPIAEPF
jgi:hypothetical protein